MTPAEHSPVRRRPPTPVDESAGRRPGPTAQPTLLALQAIAGNAAVTSMITGVAGDPTVQSLQRVQPLQRLVPGPIAPPPVRPTAPLPAEHPCFQAAQAKLSAVRRTASRHPKPAAKAAQADRAARPPADAKESQAKTAKAAAMEAAPVPVFDKTEFMASVSAAVAKATPKTLDEADKFASSGASDGIAGQIRSSVDRSKQTSAAPLADASQKAPDTGRVEDKPVTPVPQDPPPATPVVDLSSAMPAKAPAEQTDLMNGPTETNARMAEAGVTEQQLATSNESEFTAALAAKKAGEEHSRTAPVGVRQFEDSQLAASRQSAAVVGTQGVQGMIATQASGQTKVRTVQSAAQAADEQKRAEVSSRVKSIFDATKADVDMVLGGLDSLVDKAFSDGERDAKNAFSADIAARMDKYKDDRYSGVTGWARWTADLFLSLPPEVNQLYAASKQVYETKMTAVISSIADLIGRELQRAKDRVTQGRREISDYLRTLDPGLRAVGRQAADQIGAEFDALTDSITDKGKSLADDIADKYVAARQAVDDQIVAMQEENKGLWDKAKDAVGGAIETILKLKDMLAGVLARAAGAVGKIIADPIGFLGNFVTAVKTGVTNFGAHIVEHLEKGLQSWLFGTLADAGIEIPEKLDLKGIVGLILSLLGLTWASIRARLAKVLPEWVLTALESAVDVIKILSTEGIGGLWKFIVDKITDLEGQVLGQIKDFVVTKIISAGITWLISLLNPAAAFIKACKLIYDAVMWFVDNAERLKDFVDSVLDSVESIAAGGVGKVAELIESALGRAVPMVISGFASLLGLGGIAEKVKEILQTVQKPVGKIVDSIIASVIKYGKKLLGRVKGKKPDDETPQQKQQRLDQGLIAAQGLVDRLPGKSLKMQLARPILAMIKLKYRFTRLEVVPGRDGQLILEGEINPKGTRILNKVAATVDPIQVRAAMVVANQELAAAVDSYQSQQPRQPSLTIACAGGLARSQGGFSEKPPENDAAAGQRWLEADAARWGGSKELTESHLTQMLTLTPAAQKRKALLEQSIASATTDEARKEQERELDSLLRRVGSYDYPGRTKEDRAEHQEKTGEYLPRRSYQDRGVPGSTSLVHAEKLAYLATHANAVGVSRDQCEDCQSWFKAQSKDVPFIVVADPKTIRVYVDGKIKSPADFS